MGHGHTDGSYTVTTDFWAGLELELTLDYEAPCAGNGGRGGWMLDDWDIVDGTKAGPAVPDGWLIEALEVAINAAFLAGEIPEVEALKHGRGAA